MLGRCEEGGERYGGVGVALRLRGDGQRWHLLWWHIHGD